MSQNVDIGTSFIPMKCRKLRIPKSYPIFGIKTKNLGQN